MEEETDVCDLDEVFEEEEDLCDLGWREKERFERRCRRQERRCWLAGRRRGGRSRAVKSHGLLLPQLLHRLQCLVNLEDG